jgi:hypothetical protein
MHGEVVGFAPAARFGRYCRSPPVSVAAPAEVARWLPVARMLRACSAGSGECAETRSAPTDVQSVDVVV